MTIRKQGFGSCELFIRHSMQYETLQKNQVWPQCPRCPTHLFHGHITSRSVYHGHPSVNYRNLLNCSIYVHFITQIQDIITHWLPLSVVMSIRHYNGFSWFLFHALQLSQSSTNQRYTTKFLLLYQNYDEAYEPKFMCPYLLRAQKPLESGFEALY